MTAPTRRLRVIAIPLTQVLEEWSLSVMTVPKVFGVVVQGVILEVDWLFNIFVCVSFLHPFRFVLM